MPRLPAYLVDPFAPITAFSKWVGRVLTQWLPEHPLTAFLEYWIYDFVKVALLLVLTSAVLGFARRMVGVRWLRRSIGRSDWKGTLAGALLGVFTPVCSCSVTPLYASLIHSGASRQSAGAFLFAAPAVNEFAIAVVLLALGWQGALLYLVLGLGAALLTGHYAHLFGLEPCGICSSSPVALFTSARPKALDALVESFHEAVRLLARLKVALLVGTALAAVLVQYNLRPVEVMLRIGDAWWSPVVGVLLGLPLDVNAAAALPILLPLAQAGLPIGTLIALMMATTLASFPEAAVLKSLIGWRGLLKLGAWYFTYCTAVGFILNWVFA
ncbi:MAG: permease [Fimbriimonadales bacterium]|nr:permease [Fimbriimonadales bacterium]MDW8052501.1 permease [Armatimonadota bacterium]